MHNIIFLTMLNNVANYLRLIMFLQNDWFVFIFFENVSLLEYYNIQKTCVTSLVSDFLGSRTSAVLLEQ